MKKRKLKPYVIPTIYAVLVIGIFTSMMFMNASLSLNSDVSEEVVEVENNYVIDVVESSEVPVVSEVDNSVSLPYNGEDVEIEVDYYSKDDSSEVQEDSLIYYNNTYMQNTGIVYGSDDEFEIISVLGGTVKNVSTDEILGTVIEIEHSSDYISYYYCVSDSTVVAGDIVEKGDIIATSGTCALEDLEENNMLFEIYYQGKAIDPNTFYELVIEN